MTPRAKSEQGSTDWEKHVAEWLMKLRKSKFENQIVFVAALNKAGMNIGRTAVSNWESGLTRPTISDLPTIAGVLGVTPRELIPPGMPDEPEQPGQVDEEPEPEAKPARKRTRAKKAVRPPKKGKG